jgi:hypothetical protein
VRTMITPLVTELVPEPPPHRRHGENAEQAEQRPRRPRRQPYHRPSQRELVRASVMIDGRFDDYHGDAVQP